MKKTFIGIALLVTGLACFGYYATLLYRITTLPFTGQTATAKVTGFKISSNGARQVQHPSSTKHPFKGRSPWFEFKTADNQTISTYSTALQFFTFLGYEIGDEITVAYSKDAPQSAVIISWKEFPGILFMMTFGLLFIIVSKSFLLPKRI